MRTRCCRRSNTPRRSGISTRAWRVTSNMRCCVRSGPATFRRKDRGRFARSSARCGGVNDCCSTHRPLRVWRLTTGGCRARVGSRSPLAVVLLAAAGGHEFSTSSPPDLAASGSGRGGASRSLAVELVAPRGDQAAVPRRLEWRPLHGAVRYRARLAEVDRHEVWSIETSATAVDLPEPVRALVLPAKTLVWDVTAFDPADAPIGESPPERFRLE